LGKALSTTPLLQYRLQAKDKYRLREPIVIDFTLENLSDHNVWVLTWYTPLEGIKGNIFDVTCDGKPIPYEGIMARRGNPRREDYIQIPSMAAVSATVDLSEAYKIHQCNECKVKFRGRIYDFSNIEGVVPKENIGHNSMNISGNIVSFRISDSEQ
jgi:peptidyl-Lys metalloendopeptidase